MFELFNGLQSLSITPVLLLNFLFILDFECVCNFAKILIINHAEISLSHFDQVEHFEFLMPEIILVPSPML